MATQSTFCVNSLAHYLGETPFDDKHTPRDHVITALVTIGEGYHNFHHQFPMDFRNAIRWYQYDPTKWFISVMSFFGLASHLKVSKVHERLGFRTDISLRNSPTTKFARVN
jgi:stearoyl-CoA desaturase (delta-9 desaturase)